MDIIVKGVIFVGVDYLLCSVLDFIRVFFNDVVLLEDLDDHNIENHLINNFFYYMNSVKGILNV